MKAKKRSARGSIVIGILMVLGVLLWYLQDRSAVCRIRNHCLDCIYDEAADATFLIVEVSWEWDRPARGIETDVLRLSWNNDYRLDEFYVLGEGAGDGNWMILQVEEAFGEKEWRQLCQRPKPMVSPMRNIGWKEAGPAFWAVTEFLFCAGKADCRTTRLPLSTDTTGCTTAPYGGSVFFGLRES